MSFVEIHSHIYPTKGSAKPTAVDHCFSIKNDLFSVAWHFAIGSIHIESGVNLKEQGTLVSEH